MQSYTISEFLKSLFVTLLYILLIGMTIDYAISHLERMGYEVISINHSFFVRVAAIGLLVSFLESHAVLLSMYRDLSYRKAVLIGIVYLLLLAPVIVPSTGVSIVVMVTLLVRAAYILIKESSLWHSTKTQK